MPDKFYNPYNFVRPLNSPPEGHILGQCPPPPHDRYTGLSGRIHCTLTNKTPLFVSEGEPFKEETVNKHEHPHYHFFNINGTDIISGTSLRGPIRSVFEAITNSSFGAFTFKDDPLFYRKPPKVALRLVPARVEKDENSSSGYSLSLLTGYFDLNIKGTNLYAAWIPRYRNEQILKKPEHKQKHILNESDKVTIPKDCRDGRECYAAISYTKKKGFPHNQADYIAKDRREVQNWISNQRVKYKIKRGYVHLTGLNADVKQYERFFYYGKTQHVVLIGESEVNAYNHLMQDYHKRREEIKNSLTSQSQSGRESLEPSTFVKRLQKLEEGTLVYAQLSGTESEPQVKAIYPVSISRAMYEHNVRDTIEAHHPHLLPPTDINKLCLASRVFGWVSQNADNEDRSVEIAYKGRVRFSHATTKDSHKKYKVPQTLAILGSPHPTSLEFYLEGNDYITAREDGKEHGYDEDNAKIRGRKFYRHHGKFDADEAFTKPDKKSNQNRTIHGFYLPNSKWTFTIDFENLQPSELGALLWTLELSFDGKQGYHRIGYGKPLGLGSVQIQIDSIDFNNPSNRYSLEQTVPQSITDNQLDAVKAQFISDFHQGMQDVYGREFYTLDNIIDLKALLTAPEKDYPIHYPRPQYNGRGNTGNEGFKWFMDNRGANNPERLASASEDDSLSY